MPYTGEGHIVSGVRYRLDETYKPAFKASLPVFSLYLGMPNATLDFMKMFYRTLNIKMKRLPTNDFGYFADVATELVADITPETIAELHKIRETARNQDLS